MAKNFFTLYEDYKKGYDKLKAKKDFYMQDEEKNKKKIEKINQKMLNFQKQFADLWLNVKKEDTNDNK